ncbi:uncharacterized protein LOC123539994 [Mercenaria mercenaria]|uniref:uncharacterized protein LOC123539994 n=1 Tax=Mercenaria mercenaria TaxID=6596 RepID=UPI00234E6FC4|nr:uncharacterized protein LOC123539994 [Mercenaria mercenaria]
MQTRMIIVVSVVACVVLFALGIIIGHFAIEKSRDEETQGDQQQLSTGCETAFSERWKKYRKGYLDKCVADSCTHASCNTEDLPRTYLAYHLNGKPVVIDGRLDEEAWSEIPWSETFMDIRGPDYPEPYFSTRFKVRWDDDRLYVGALMEETDFWGTYTQDESPVWRENAFEVYAVPDGSMHNYKEMQVSVRNVSWDLMLEKAYMDNRDKCVDRNSVAISSWNSSMEKATHTDGIINNPNGQGSYWSAEWSFSFAALAEHTDRPSNQPTPEVQEAWFFIFARPEYKFKIVNGQYKKDEDAATEWWSWQPMYTVNLHMPSRFGLVQFKRSMTDKTFNFNKWHLYRALFEVFEAEHKYNSVNGMFIDDLKKLPVAPKIMSSECVTISIQSNDTYFRASVKSKLYPNMQTGNIRPDRYVWFT